jgi:hypothetical protein
MKRMLWMGAASLLCMAAMSSLSTARAIMIAPAPIPQRVATADCIIVGKVTGFADKTVSVPAVPGAKDKQQYQIALIKVETNLHGAKGVKEIRVGFIPPMQPPAGSAGRPVIRRPNRGVTFTLNQEACLFLTKHQEGDFYTAPMYFSVINKQGNANFDKEVDEVKRYAKLLADPEAGLEAKDKEDRFLTAGMLIYHYRQRRPGNGEPKTAPIDAALSKKILRTLADADWNAKPGRPGPLQMTPQTLFYQLNLTAKDGWTPPKDFKQFPDEAKKWLKDNADKYVIQRFVHEKKDKEDKSEK